MFLEQNIEEKIDFEIFDGFGGINRFYFVNLGSTCKNRSKLSILFLKIVKSQNFQNFQIYMFLEQNIEEKF